MLTIQAGTFHLQLDLATLLLWAVVGIVAGFLASRAMLGHGLGLVGDLIVGIIGAYLGGIIAAFFGIRVIVSGLPAPRLDPGRLRRRLAAVAPAALGRLRSKRAKCPVMAAVGPPEFLRLPVVLVDHLIQGKGVNGARLALLEGRVDGCLQRRQFPLVILLDPLPRRRAFRFGQGASLWYNRMPSCDLPGHMPGGVIAAIGCRRPARSIPRKSCPYRHRAATMMERRLASGRDQEGGQGDEPTG